MFKVHRAVAKPSPSLAASRTIPKLFRLLLRTCRPFANPEHRSFLVHLIDSDALPLSSLHVSQEIRTMALEGQWRESIGTAFRQGGTEDLDSLLRLMPILLRVNNTIREIDSYWGSSSSSERSHSLIEGAILVSKISKTRKNKAVEAKTEKSLSEPLKGAFQRIADQVRDECQVVLEESANTALDRQPRAIDFVKAYNRVRQRLANELSPDLGTVDGFFKSIGPRSTSSGLKHALTFHEVFRRLQPTGPVDLQVEGVALPRQFMVRVTGPISNDNGWTQIGGTSVAVDHLTKQTWLANYKSTNALQEISLSYDATEGFVQAIKLDGDQYVPKNQVTWRFEHTDPAAALLLDTPIKGQLQVAREGYTDAAFMPATFTIKLVPCPASPRGARQSRSPSAERRSVLEIHITSPPTPTPTPTLTASSSVTDAEPFLLRCVPTTAFSTTLLNFSSHGGMAGPVPPSKQLEIMRSVFGPTAALETLERAAMKVATDRTVIARLAADISTGLLNDESGQSAAGSLSKAAVAESFYWLGIRKTFETVYIRRRNSRK